MPIDPVGSGSPLTSAHAPSAGLADGSPLAANPQLSAIAAGNGQIARGTRGDHVALVQSTLEGLGYPMPRYGADGSWGSESMGATRAFQRDHQLPETGVVNAETLVAIDQARAEAAGATGGSGSTTGASAGSLSSKPGLEEVAAGRATFANGSRGEGVKHLQTALEQLGYTVPGGADGWFGSGTRGAVVAFQKDAGLTADGIVGKRTLEALDRRLAAGGSGTTTTTTTTTDVDMTGITPGTNVAGAEAEGIQNPRFTGAALADVAAGRTSLGPGARGEGVKAVQTALLDLGFKLPVYGADGAAGGEMKLAVQRFQLEMGLPRTGLVNRATLEALDRVAPPPGKAIEKMPDYESIFADGRADMTIAIGYDEGGTAAGTTQKTLRQLSDQGFRRIRPESLSPSRREELGVGPDRYTPGASYFLRQGTDPQTGKEIDFVVRVITPDASDDPAEVAGMFQKAMEQDEVIVYNGHARYGTGPDFDDIHSGAGNFVINEAGNTHGSRPPGYLQDAIRGRDTDLGPVGSPGKYQLVFFNACSTENYLPSLRERFPGRNNENTDFVATTIPTYVASGAEQVGIFMDGVLNRRSMNQISGSIGENEAAWTQRFTAGEPNSERKIAEAGATALDNGFLGNPRNRLIDSPNG